MRRSLVHLALLASAVAEQYACPVTAPAAADQNHPNTPQKPTLPDPVRFVGGQLKPFTGPTDEVTSPVYDAATGSGAGEAYGALAAEVVKPETGRRVALNGGLGFWFRTLTGWQRTRDVGMLTRQNGAELEEILAFPGDAARPVVDSTYPLTREGVRDAFERLKSRRARGKIVIDVA